MKRTPLATAILALTITTPAWAAVPPVAPDAGRLTRELQAPVEAPRPGVSVVIPEPSRDVVTPGGLKITVTDVTFDGNTVFTDAQLRAVLGSAIGQPHDLAGLYALADQISAYYRAAGYSFAKAFVPQNGFNNGVLSLYVVEGRVGAITVQGDSRTQPRHLARAEALLAPLKDARAIYAPDLERQVLLLGDRPGFSVVLPTLKPGSQLGTGDLDVRLTRGPLITGNASLSNHGNRYTGYTLARINAQINSPFLFGDQFSVTLMGSDERLKTGAINYSLPLNRNGLRGSVGFSRTDYRLGREFANLQASGSAEITTFGLSYPWLRSRSSNLTISAQSQHKRFFDEQQAVGSQQRRASDLGALLMNFDHADRFGLTYGQAEAAFGNFTSDDPIDLGRTKGSFTRLNLDITRLQRITDRTTFVARFNGQQARRNLDSSESYSLGGPFAVRAYPTGEGTGDEGMLTQLELRFRATDTVTPFVFYDAGRVRLEETATTPGKNRRVLTGAGAGVRLNSGRLSLEALAAGRLAGGDPQTDPRDRALTGWVNVGWAF